MASRWASLSPSSKWETSIAAFYASARGSSRDDEGKRSTRPCQAARQRLRRPAARTTRTSPDIALNLSSQTYLAIASAAKPEKSAVARIRKRLAVKRVEQG